MSDADSFRQGALHLKRGEPRNLARRSMPWIWLTATMAFGCGEGTTRDLGHGRASGAGGGTATTSSTTLTTSSATSGVGGSPINIDAGSCKPTCSPDFHSLVSCDGTIIQQCSGDQACDVLTGACKNACDVAVNNKQSIGCEYYATFMDLLEAVAATSCFAVFVANTWNTPAHITVDYDGKSLPVADFARIPQGSGPALTYKPFDAANGIPPGEVTVLFLSGEQGQQGTAMAFCPIASAIPKGVSMLGKTGIGHSFRIGSDVPVVSYQINPYGGGSAAITGASLLLPTSVWDLNYVAVNAAPPFQGLNPSMNIVAAQDGTHVTMLPVAAVAGGGGIPSGPANQQLVIALNKGEHAQLSQVDELTGSVIQSDKPIGFMAGHECITMPKGVVPCDHAEQMVPPIKALGDEYVGVMPRPRKSEPGMWRVVGAVNGTTLNWSSNVGGPATLDQGQAAEFTTGDPFVVKSQDKDHPFMLFAYMTSSGALPGDDAFLGYGDPDFVISVPPKQYLQRYVFFADPTYPETNLVLVRAKDEGGKFHEVNLDCAGDVKEWQALGDYEWARVDLGTGNFQSVGGCSTGRHEIKSDGGRFGLWVWGWGGPDTTVNTKDVSYGYPGGMNVTPINKIVVPPMPK